jgi:hypothetical protein
MKRSILALIIILGMVNPAAKDGLSVNPHVGHAPQRFRVKVTVESPETATKVCLVADGAIQRVSCWEHPVRTTQIDWTGFPGGPYVFELQVTRTDGKTVLFQDRACVVGAINEAEGGCDQGSDTPDF